MEDNKLLKLIVDNLQKIDEKSKSKPDFLDLDGDGDKKEPMKKAAKDKKKAEMDEKRKRKRKTSTKFPAGYKAQKGSDRHDKLKRLTMRYKNAKTKSQKDAAVKARQRYEKTLQPSGIQSQYNEGKVILNEAEFFQLVREMKDILEKKKKKAKKVSKKVHNALKKKAEKHNAPLGALKTVYRKGQGAFFSSGSRPGQNQHSWAMARVNSFLKGGKARQVDAAQWKQVQKHRAKKRK